MSFTYIKQPKIEIITTINFLYAFYSETVSYENWPAIKFIIQQTSEISDSIV